MTTQRLVLGILGGMGPRSSAEFLATLYECAGDGRAEQDMPIAVLRSDPTFPRRTVDPAGPELRALRDRVEDGLQHLVDAGCHELVLCCFTAHHVVPALSPAIAARLRSLIDLTLDELRAATGPCLVLCSSASRRLELLERHSAWAAAAPHVRFPDDTDQRRIDTCIFEVKTRGATPAMVAELDQLVARYRVDDVVFACSELHMLNRGFEHQQVATAYRRRDPLYTLARAVCAR